VLLRSKVLPAILQLDPVRDHQRIVFLSFRCDFPFDSTRALEMALFRTFCVPSIGALLDRTGEFCGRTQKRYDDTDLLVSEIIEHGYESERGARAIARMNEIHGRFEIANADFLYVLSTFVFEPLRWIDRYGWRDLTQAERQSSFLFWRGAGERMNITGIPADFAEFERFNRAYEAEHFRLTPGARRVAESTMRLFAGWAPGPLQPLVPPIIRATLDAPLLRAMELPPAAPWLQSLVTAALQIRGQIANLFPRTTPKLRTVQATRTYGCAYAIEKLGPEPAKPE
jgi:hypothetical protein